MAHAAPVVQLEVDIGASPRSLSTARSDDFVLAQVVAVHSHGVSKASRREAQPESTLWVALRG